MTPRKEVVVIGAGGHAKVVISTLQAAGWQVNAVLDDRPQKWGSEIFGVPVRGPISAALEMPESGAVIAIGDNASRRRLAQELRLRWITAVHPAAVVHASVRLGAGTVVFAGAVIQPDASVGAHVIINTAATVDHDCVLGDFAQLAPGAHLAGEVRIEEGAFLGVGTSVIPGKCVGAWTTVGAGAAVVTDIPGGVVAMGVPARVSILKKKP